MDNTDGMAKIVIKTGASFASQLTQGDTVYVVRNNIDLNSGTVAIPSGVILKFEGGKISNGTLVGNGTVIEAPNRQIFSSITFSGTFIGTLNAVWIGATPNNSAFDNSVILQNWLNGYSAYFKTIEFPCNTYYFLTPVAMSGDLRNREIKGNNSKFLVNIPDVDNVG